MIRSTSCPYTAVMPLPEDMIFCDVTIREGEMTPGVSYTEAEKFELARRLDAFGVSQIQLNIPGFDPRIIRMNRQICSMGLRAKTEVMTNGRFDNWREQIDAANECGSDVIHCSVKIGEFNTKKWVPASRDALYERIAGITAYLKQTGKLVNITLTDATRAELPFLLRCIEIAAQHGADRIRLADSYGVATPESCAVMVSNAVRVVQPYSTIIGVHCHNDFGLALANTLASIRAGARLVDASINGLGDRAGNTRLAELAVALEALYKRPTGMDVSQIMSLSKFLERISGSKIHPSMPLVGANVFAEEMAGHAIEQFECPVDGRSIVPSDIGGKLDVIYGKYTNERVIELTAARAGRYIDPKLYPVILDRLTAISEADKGHCIYEDQFWDIVESVSTRSGTAL